VRVLSRYILKEFLGNLAVGLLIFSFVLLLDRFFEIVDILINKGGSLWITAKLLLLLLPSTLSLTLPMACLLAALLTYGRFSETSEIVAMRASGLTAWSYIKTPYISAIIICLFLIPFNSFWAPHSHSQFRQLYLDILGRNPLLRIEEKTFVELSEYHIYVQRKDRKTQQMKGVSIYKTPQQGTPMRIYASMGEAAADARGVTFTLHDGHVSHVDAAQPERWVNTQFDTYELRIPFQTGVRNAEKTIEEMDYAQLRSRIEELKKKNTPFSVLLCQIHLRWALSVTPLLFVALGIPLAIRIQRGGRSIGFALSLGIIVLYYVLLMGGTGLGQRGAWPVIPAVWSANGILLIAAAFFTKRFLKQ